MKKLIYTFLILSLVTSCSNQKGDFSLLKEDVFVLKADHNNAIDQEEFFSKDLTYNCDLDNCNDNIVLVAAKTDKGIEQCSGTLLTNNSLLISGSCFDTFELSPQSVCDETIETRTLSGDIAKCSSVETHYQSTSSETIYIVNLDRDVNLKNALNFEKISEEDTKLTAVSIKDGKQVKQKCEVTFTSLANMKSLNTNSEYLDIKNCELGPSTALFQNDSLIGLVTKKNEKVDLYGAINSLCLNGECDRAIHSKKDKMIKAISDSEDKGNVVHLNFIQAPNYGFDEYNIDRHEFSFDELNIIFTPDLKSVCRKKDIKNLYLLKTIFPYIISNLDEIIVKEEFDFIDYVFFTIANFNPKNIKEHKQSMQDRNYFYEKVIINDNLTYAEKFALMNESRRKLVPRCK